MKEKLSALIDGELEPAELHALLDQLRKDPALRQEYGRYIQAQATLHDEDGFDIADRVWAQLDSEPVIFAPARHKSAGFTPARKFAAGLAVAATVAGVAVGSLNWLSPVQTQSPTLVASAPNPTDYVRTSGTRWQVNDPKLEDDLNVYLVEHGGFAGSSGMNGVRSYVKVAGYDN